MIYLIGGGARCGKSTLAKSLISKLPGAAYLSGDSFRQSLKPILPTLHTSEADTSSPEAYIRYYKDNTEQAIDEVVKRAESIWPFIERYIVSYLHESYGDLIVESVDIWPHLVSTLDVPCQAVFLVDTDVKQWKRVTVNFGENDWISAKKLSPEQIEAWATYNALRGERVLADCKEHGYEFEDIAVQGFANAQFSALRKLI